jgi:hypothetical protein
LSRRTAHYARSGHFVARLGLREGPPDGRKEIFVSPTNGRTSEACSTTTGTRATKLPQPAQGARPAGHAVG